MGPRDRVMVGLSAEFHRAEALAYATWGDLADNVIETLDNPRDIWAVENAQGMRYYDATGACEWGTRAEAQAVLDAQPCPQGLRVMRRMVTEWRPARD